jgi:hypothetical protein
MSPFWSLPRALAHPAGEARQMRAHGGVDAGLIAVAVGEEGAADHGVPELHQTAAEAAHQLERHLGRIGLVAPGEQAAERLGAEIDDGLEVAPLADAAGRDLAARRGHGDDRGAGP